MEVYGEKPKRFTKDWWDYIWLYYKWHIVAVIVAVFIVVTTLQQCATRPSYDLQITFVTDKTDIPPIQAEAIENLAGSVIEDATQNGEKEVYVMSLCMSENDLEQMQAQYVKFTAELAMPQSYVFILSRQYADTVIENELFESTEAWAPGVESDGYVVSLKDNEKMKELGFDMEADELYIGILKLRDEGDEVEKVRYENGIRFARSLLGLG